MAYRHNDSFHRHNVVAHRVRKVTFFVVLIALVAAAAIGIDFAIGELSTNNSVVSRETTTSVQSANVSVYRTEHFQFQAPNDWVLVSSESREDKFVYVKNSGSGLINQRIVVYIDRPVDKRVEHNIGFLYEVEVNSLGDIIPLGGVSEHCDTSWPKDLRRNPDRILHEGVVMECTPNTQEYNVIVGKSNGSDRINLGLDEEKIFTIVFSDLTAYPTSGDLPNIVSSFRAL